MKTGEIMKYSGKFDNGILLDIDLTQLQIQIEEHVVGRSKDNQTE